MAAAIFISHASADGAAATELVAALEAAGHRCWIAPRDIRAGLSYPSEILRGIQGCAAMVVLVSAPANASPHVAKEVELAHREGKRLLPLRIEIVEPEGDLRYWLSAAQWIEGYRLPPPDRARAVVAALDGGAPVAGTRPRRGRDWKKPAFMLAGGAALGLGLYLALVAGGVFGVRIAEEGTRRAQVAASPEAAERCHQLRRRLVDDYSSTPVRFAVLGRPAIDVLADCEQAAATAPDDAALAAEYGWALAAMGRFDEALPAFRRAESAGDGLGAYGLAVFTLFGLAGVEKDETQARLLMERARLGVPLASARLAWFYAQGLGGVEKSDIEARRLFQAAADQGNVNGQVNLGLMYQNGLAGLPRSPARAARLFRAAAEQDYDFAIRLLTALCTGAEAAAAGDENCAGYR
ncbi:toll/interleukin-1 receptor domain-containing protein [Zavarzinia aquatilis]|uniref:TIR domain-containing protein n=1 Tax=Zavarzinia aquatilis TaxID=2211142 RepID=A0A317DZZ0_9PROT|nr:toll/interleukin-1 receptor domain-containing protein [Zavarzinia aquatilis]PWR18475.1 hypothetical protein DKG74_18815 [Zavarzinia aquatilis]